MKNKFYMNEFKYFDGEEYITFNIIDLNEKTIVVLYSKRRAPLGALLFEYYHN